MLLENRVAIITGAAQGIGRACAERFAAEGARVVLCDINENEGRRVAHDIDAGRGVARFVRCDVSKAQEVRGLVTAALDAFGRVDVLVNNAAVLDDVPFLDLSESEFDRVLATNLKGAFLLGQAVARHMIGQPRLASATQAGAIVNMSSVNAVFALPDHVAYSISKGGISQLTKAMAIALAPHGIRVNAVGPGTIATPMIKAVDKDAAARRRILSRTPLGRYGRPQEVAAIVAWLASEEASYVTGTTVYADGGRLPLNYVVPVPEAS
jgi:NAD(P)-dependent dehydrogenase (short-subunit alcohol dehydrogenase family)